MGLGLQICSVMLFLGGYAIQHQEGVWSESAPSQEPGTELAFCTGDGDGIEEGG